MSDTASAKYPLLVSRERSANAIRHGLRLFVGRGRRYSVKELSNATGVKDRVIECAMCEADSLDWRPMPVEALLSLATFLGADFTNLWIGLAGQGAFELPDDEPDPGELAADTSEDTAKLVRMAADHDLSNDDPGQLSSTGSRMMRHGAQLISFSERARRRA